MIGDEAKSSQDPLASQTIGREMQAVTQSPTQDNSTASSSHFSSDHPGSPQSASEVDGDGAGERRHAGGSPSQDSDSGT